MSFETITYSVEGPVATVTLNRPDRLNTIVPPMPDEFEAAIEAATADDAVKVIVVRGAGRSFCAGYDFGGGFHHWDEQLTTDGRWDPGKDFIGAGAYGPTQKFMASWRTPKPVIAQVHGWCVGGGSDMALCADLVIASRGRADRHAVLADLGLLPERDVDLPARPRQGEGARADRQAAVRAGGRRRRADQRGGPVRSARGRGRRAGPSSSPRSRSSQLAAMKLVVNQAYENMGLGASQTLGPILDGLMRNTPDAEAFIAKAAARGGRRGDDGAGRAVRRLQRGHRQPPDPGNVIRAD